MRSIALVSGGCINAFSGAFPLMRPESGGSLTWWERHGPHVGRKSSKPDCRKQFFLLWSISRGYRVDMEHCDAKRGINPAASQNEVPEKVRTTAVGGCACNM